MQDGKLSRCYSHEGTRLLTTMCQNFWKEKSGCLYNVTDVKKPVFAIGLWRVTAEQYLDNYLNNGGNPPCESLTPGIKVSQNPDLNHQYVDS